MPPRRAGERALDYWQGGPVWLCYRRGAWRTAMRIHSGGCLTTVEVFDDPDEPAGL